MIIKKLAEQILKHDVLCEKLFKERFSHNKHDGEWNDKLYTDYMISKNRIDLLMELITETK